MELVIFNWWWLCVPLVCWFHWCPVCLFPSPCLPVKKSLINIFPPKKCYFVTNWILPSKTLKKTESTCLISHDWRFTVRGKDVGHLRYRLPPQNNFFQTISFSIGQRSNFVGHLIQFCFSPCFQLLNWPRGIGLIWWSNFLGWDWVRRVGGLWLCSRHLTYLIFTQTQLNSVRLFPRVSIIESQFNFA